MGAEPMTTPAAGGDQEDVRAGSQVDETRKPHVLLIGESPYLLSLWRPPLAKAGCQCHFAESHQEMGKLLRHTELDIVLSLNGQHGLPKIVPLLPGPRASIFHTVPVKEDSWWLPPLR